MLTLPWWFQMNIRCNKKKGGIKLNQINRSGEPKTEIKSSWVRIQFRLLGCNCYPQSLAVQSNHHSERINTQTHTLEETHTHTHTHLKKNPHTTTQPPSHTHTHTHLRDHHISSHCVTQRPTRPSEVNGGTGSCDSGTYPFFPPFTSSRPFMCVSRDSRMLLGAWRQRRGRGGCHGDKRINEPITYWYPSFCLSLNPWTQRLFYHSEEGADGAGGIWMCFGLLPGWADVLMGFIPCKYPMQIFLLCIHWYYFDIVYIVYRIVFFFKIFIVFFLVLLWSSFSILVIR